MRPPGCSPAGPKPARAPHVPARAARLLLALLLLPAFAAPARPRAPHWNETAEKKLEVLAVGDVTLQQNSSSNNSYRTAVQKEITLPARLVYYINQDTESPYHILDTKARHQQKHNKAVHLAQASFQIEAFGSKFILDLVLNK
ncbi:disintegrin and metalloproteinase domain-containing protein 23-like [Carlito syrichta]|uniref:Disintegrin and metalloproteinase domain-containing protein 23-like n=1 Tax=Carlito syrichta TaxID=1868482 RepID=A0A1U7T570_CARSF|nr:disintegrin and metalloproteinase domain-containing protein 23-like [Carlito syrichta]